MSPLSIDAPVGEALADVEALAEAEAEPDADAVGAVTPQSPCAACETHEPCTPPAPRGADFATPDTYCPWFSPAEHDGSTKAGTLALTLGAADAEADALVLAETLSDGDTDTLTLADGDTDVLADTLGEAETDVLSDADVLPLTDAEALSLNAADPLVVATLSCGLVEATV